MITCNSFFLFFIIIVDTIPSDQSLSGERRCESCPVNMIADPSKRFCTPCGISNCSNCVSFINGVCFTQSLSPPTSLPFPFYANYTTSLVLCIVSLILVFLFLCSISRMGV